jgi:cytochrome c-type biogenesis protein CcmH/NrfG
MQLRQKQSNKKRTSVKLTSIHLTCFTILILLLAGLNLLVYFSPPKTIVVHAKDTTPLVRTYYLKNLLREHPTYREGWAALARLEAQLGRMKEAKLAIDKVIELDPNYEEIDNLQALLK